MICRHSRIGVVHQVVEHAGLLHIGGIAPDDPTLGMAGQTAQVLDKLAAILAAHGSDRTRVLSATAFITDMRLKPEMNAVWVAFFTPDHLPARVTPGIVAIEEGVLIEISAIAVKLGELG